MEKYFIGVDDAGRGPVIGPMVLAGVLIKESQEKELKDIGVKDSKLLTPSKRRNMGRTLRKNFDYHVEGSTPKEIDNCDNLNNLEAIKAAMIINKLSEGISGEIEAIIDCPSVNTVEWQAYLEKLIINKKIKIKAEHKADMNYPVVSAASIIAKEIREEEIDEIRRRFDVKFGSGYPSDPQTKDFIKYNYKNPKYEEIIRHSWDTVKKLHEKAAQRKLI
jgi:ribonuclease HII